MSDKSATKNELQFIQQVVMGTLITDLSSGAKAALVENLKNYVKSPSRRHLKEYIEIYVSLAGGDTSDLT